MARDLPSGRDHQGNQTWLLCTAPSKPRVSFAFVLHLQSLLVSKAFLWDKSREETLWWILSAQNSQFSKTQEWKRGKKEKEKERKQTNKQQTGKWVFFYHSSITLYVTLSITPLDILDRREPGRGDLCIRKLTAGHLELFVPGGVLLYLFFSFFLSPSLSRLLSVLGVFNWNTCRVSRLQRSELFLPAAVSMH